MGDTMSGCGGSGVDTDGVDISLVVKLGIENSACALTELTTLTTTECVVFSWIFD